MYMLMLPASFSGRPRSGFRYTCNAPCPVSPEANFLGYRLAPLVCSSHATPCLLWGNCKGTMRIAHSSVHAAHVKLTFLHRAHSEHPSTYSGCKMVHGLRCSVLDPWVSIPCKYTVAWLVQEGFSATLQPCPLEAYKYLPIYPTTYLPR